MQVNFTATQTPDTIDRFASTAVKSEKSVSNTQEMPKQEKSTQSEEIKNLESALAEKNITLKFRRDTETNQVVIEFIDSESGNAIRQLPSDVSLELSRLFAKIQGRFIDTKV